MGGLEQIGAIIALMIVLISPYQQTQTYTAVVSAYTCEADDRNPMYPCGRTRWGREHSAPQGAACPVDWKGYVVIVNGRAYLCDDTGRDDYYGTTPHIDLRLDTYDQARQWGVQTIQIRVRAINMLAKEKGGYMVRCDFGNCQNHADMYSDRYDDARSMAYSEGWHLIKWNKEKMWLCETCYEYFQAHKRELGFFNTLAKIKEEREEEEGKVPRTKKARKQAGLSVGQVVRLTGWHWQIASDLDSGVYPPDNRQVKVLADLYGVTVPWLRGDDTPLPAQTMEMIKLAKLPPDEEERVIDLCESLGVRGAVHIDKRRGKR